VTALTSPAATNETSSPRGSVSKDNSAAEQTDICQGLSGKWALIYVALFAVAVTAIVIANRISLATVNDTLLLLHSFEMLQRFSSLWSNDNSNPLQAMFDIFPSGLRLDTINNLIARALFGPGVHVVFFYVTSGLCRCPQLLSSFEFGSGGGFALLGG
jgi:hypothetical protein